MKIKLMKKINPPLIVITGPTASGKTTLTIDLAKKIDAEIIQADSRTIYKGLDIVSAKPDKDEMRGIYHHLIDIKEPLNEPYSAGDFVKDAKECIKKIQAKGKSIIVSGGTWFYIKCLFDEKELPEIPENRKLRAELEKLEPEILWQKLNDIDPKRANQIHPNNKERVIRALEMTEALKGEVSGAERKINTEYKAIWFANEYIDEKNRPALYQRINERVDKMAAGGLYQEWKNIVKKYGRTKVLENTIGYKEFFELEDNVYKNVDEAIEKIKQRTRNFAKRQLTFFKSKNDIIKVQNADDIIKYII